MTVKDIHFVACLQSTYGMGPSDIGHAADELLNPKQSVVIRAKAAKLERVYNQTHSSALSEKAVGIPTLAVVCLERDQLSMSSGAIAYVAFRLGPRSDFVCIYGQLLDAATRHNVSLTMEPRAVRMSALANERIDAFQDLRIVLSMTRDAIERRSSTLAKDWARSPSSCPGRSIPLARSWAGTPSTKVSFDVRSALDRLTELLGDLSAIAAPHRDAELVMSLLPADGVALTEFEQAMWNAGNQRGTEVFGASIDLLSMARDRRGVRADDRHGELGWRQFHDGERGARCDRRGVARLRSGGHAPGHDRVGAHDSRAPPGVRQARAAGGGGGDEPMVAHVSEQFPDPTAEERAAMAALSEFAALPSTVDTSGLWTARWENPIGFDDQANAYGHNQDDEF